MIRMIDWADRLSGHPVYELEALERRYFLSAVSLDPLFAEGGKLIDRRIRPAHGSDVQLLVQNDGKILVGGATEKSGLFLARYNADGAFDKSFSGDGLINTSDIWSFLAMTLQQDGKILVAGYSGIERLNSDGSLDQTFGDGGILRMPTGPNDMMVQASGKIVLARDELIVRLNPDGSPDLNFGWGTSYQTGYGEAYIGGFENSALQLRPYPGGGFVATVINGEPDVDWDYYYVRRFDEQGKPVDSFGYMGTVQPKTDDMDITDMEVTSDGRIVFLANWGFETDRNAIYEYRSNGEPDRRFGKNGVDIDAPLDTWGSRMTLSHDGSILVFSWQPELVAVRLNAAGKLDHTFGKDGIARTGLVASNATVAGVEDNDGHLILAGTMETGSGVKLFLVRFTSGSDAKPQVPPKPAEPQEPEDHSEEEEDDSEEEPSAVVIVGDSVAPEEGLQWVNGEGFFTRDAIDAFGKDEAMVWE